MSSTLGLRYAPYMNADVAKNLEIAGRHAGLPLSQLELLGQDEGVALDFVAAIIARRSQQFLATVDWDRLEALYQQHREMPLLTNV